jgi:hypothetical protein
MRSPSFALDFAGDGKNYQIQSKAAPDFAKCYDGQAGVPQYKDRPECLTGKQFQSGAATARTLWRDKTEACLGIKIQILL